MKKQEILKHIDHTLLKPFADWESIKQLCEEAIKFNTASVCIPPCYIKKIRENFPKLNICTVVGFPLGYSVLAAKKAEVTEAIADGANEIDMVINITDVKNKDFDKIEHEITTLKKECGEKILKVIIETCFLEEEEKIKMCNIVTKAGADYIKTSTGFGTAGATLHDVKLMVENTGETVKVKAAGGIKTLQDLEDFLSAGADRIGTSSAVSLLEGSEAKDY